LNSHYFSFVRGKKKLEKALQQAQQDIMSLTEKLIRVQNGKSMNGCLELL